MSSRRVLLCRGCSDFPRQSTGKATRVTIGDILNSATYVQADLSNLWVSHVTWVYEEVKKSLLHPTKLNVIIGLFLAVRKGVGKSGVELHQFWTIVQLWSSVQWKKCTETQVKTMNTEIRWPENEIVWHRNLNLQCNLSQMYWFNIVLVQYLWMDSHDIYQLFI